METSFEWLEAAYEAHYEGRKHRANWNWFVFRLLSTWERIVA